VGRMQLDVDVFGSAFRDDPYLAYEEIRGVGNVVWNVLLNAWMVVTYDETCNVAADTVSVSAPSSAISSSFRISKRRNMITSDGAYHRRLRNGLAPLFHSQCGRKSGNPASRKSCSRCWHH
jgi:cytochrome P450